MAASPQIPHDTNEFSGKRVLVTGGTKGAGTRLPRGADYVGIIVEGFSGTA